MIPRFPNIQASHVRKHDGVSRLPLSGPERGLGGEVSPVLGGGRSSASG